MKTFIKTSLVIFVFAAIAACTKENIKTSSAASQSSNLSSSQLSSEAAQQLRHIGDSFGGGIIFYIDSTKKHGLIASYADISDGIAWYNGNYSVTGAKGSGIGAGSSNTTKIVQTQGSVGNYAALLCFSYSGGGKNDWYLPSKLELNQLYIHRSKVPGLSATNYWSSTESDVNNAFDQEFGGGFKFADDKSFTIHVRAVRSY